LNAADEVAIAAFLGNQLSFGGIAQVIEQVSLIACRAPSPAAC